MKVKGTTVIDHAIQVSLRLSHIEYIVTDLIYRHNKRYKTGGVVYKKYFTEAGLMPHEVNRTIKSLKEKTVLEFDHDNKRIKTDNCWNRNFDDDVQFDNIWKICPTGNKQKARENFLKVNSMITFDTLVEYLTKYVNSKEDKKYLMHLFRWLDPKLKHWEDNLETMKVAAVAEDHDTSLDVNF